MRWIAVAFLGISISFSGCAAPATTAPAAPAAAGAGAAAAPAAAAPAAAHPTLLDFLGVHQIAQGIGKLATCGLSVLGSCFPELEPKPPMVPITAAGGEGASSAEQAAAEIKAEEDKAAQKIKAIRYLAGLGCVKCYSGIEEAFLGALEDCTEAVRFEAAKGLREAAGNPCSICDATSCCSPKIVKKLNEIAQETDSQGCFVESSARVRRMARLALNRCAGRTLAVDEEATPDEGPAGDTADEPVEPPPESAVGGQPNTAQAAIKLFETTGTRAKAKPIHSEGHQAPLNAAQPPTADLQSSRSAAYPGGTGYSRATRATFMDGISVDPLRIKRAQWSDPKVSLPTNVGR